MPSVPPSPQELDAYREGADRFIAELDEEYYLHFAGLKDSSRAGADLRAPRGLTELERAQALGAAVDGDRRIRELWRFSCEGYFGRLTREHAEKLAGLEAELEVTVDGETVPFRMLRAGDRERARPRPAAAARRRDVGGDRGAPEPCLRGDCRDRPRGAARARRVELPRALRALRPRPARPRRPVPCLPRLDRGALRAAARPLAARHPWLRPRRGRALGHPADDPLGPVGRGVPRGQDGAGAALDALRPRDRPRRPVERPPRHRAATAEDPARVLRADRGARQGDARDPADRRRRRLARVLPRGRPRRALREHRRRPRDGVQAPRRLGGHRGLGDAAPALDRTSPPG